jgi:hypothetical protein
MANEHVKVGIDDIVASATTGVLRAMEARKISLEGANATDFVRSGFNVDFWIRCGGLIDPDIFGPRGPLGGPRGPGGFIAGGGAG